MKHLFIHYAIVLLGVVKGTVPQHIETRAVNAPSELTVLGRYGGCLRCIWPSIHHMSLGIYFINYRRPMGLDREPCGRAEIGINRTRWTS